MNQQRLGPHFRRIETQSSILMSIAPEPLLTGYLSVLHHAIITARNWAAAADRNEQLSDLMDAVHNIPELLNRWEECDEPPLRAALKRYDVRWAKSDRDVSLCGILNDALQMGNNRPEPISTMSSPSTISYIIQLEDESELRFDTAEQVCDYLDQLAASPKVDILVLTDHGRRPSLLKRVFGWSERLVSPHFALARAGDAATLTFMDENGSEYRAVDPERPSNVPLDTRQKLSGGEPTPANPEFCMTPTRAFAAARDYMLQRTRPDWLTYRYVR